MGYSNCLSLHAVGLVLYMRLSITRELFQVQSPTKVSVFAAANHNYGDKHWTLKTETDKNKIHQSQLTKHVLLIILGKASLC